MYADTTITCDGPADVGNVPWHVTVRTKESFGGDEVPGQNQILI